MALVLGTGRSCDTHMRGVSSEQVNATYMPKSVTTISDDRSFGQKRMCSGLSPGHLSGPKISQRDVLEIPMDVVQVHAGSNRTGGRKIAQRWFSVSHAGREATQTYRSTATASSSEKSPRWLMRSESSGSPPTASSKAR